MLPLMIGKLSLFSFDDQTNWYWGTRFGMHPFGAKRASIHDQLSIGNQIAEIQILIDKTSNKNFLKFYNNHSCLIM